MPILPKVDFGNAIQSAWLGWGHGQKVHLNWQSEGRRVLHADAQASMGRQQSAWRVVWRTLVLCLRKMWSDLSSCAAILHKPSQAVGLTVVPQRSAE